MDSCYNWVTIDKSIQVLVYMICFYLQQHSRTLQCFIRPVARVGSVDPVRVLRLYTTITLDEVCSIYCWDICTICRYRSKCYSTCASGPTTLSVCSRLCLVANCPRVFECLSVLILYCTMPFITTCVDTIGTVFWYRPVLRYPGKALILVAKLLLLL